MPWLPPPAKGDVESALGRLIEGWLADWIVRPGPLRVQARTRGETRSLQWQGEPWAALGRNADIEALLGRDACGGEGNVAHPADREILRGVGARLLDELASFLAGLGDGVANERSSSRQTAPDGELFTVASGTGGWSIGLALSPQAVVAVRKAVAGGAVAGTGHRAVLGNRRNALASQVARLGCHLGKACLSAGDIAMLAAGDVIVLDRQPAVPLILTVEGHQCASGKAKIVRSAEGASITIAERPSLLRKVG
ncbi:FliM/FliN family flagellar motor C-terminal domain-containing protein [Telmatospirillum sp.]|uniref:FliM/FliN family flagellar motor C-terminal domain-containing protein n=1 Tax=Telmatospirillum sp. TaxID=2079197 RepID=UPI002849DB89|nr:FliM/FliN family flagellar motor C-terminal domain-containing protein [Telmatospirillum sp.]MDR3438083.1 FliM/FliN family flagellar motor C-terminal domain-containing protein [Telmatospirillum sp.]